MGRESKPMCVAVFCDWVIHQRNYAYAQIASHQSRLNVTAPHPLTLSEYTQMIIDKEKVIEFLRVHPNPHIEVTTTIIDGGVSCIRPVPTICGEELHCNSKTYPHLKKLISEQPNNH